MHICTYLICQQTLSVLLHDYITVLAGGKTNENLGRKHVVVGYVTDCKCHIAVLLDDENTVTAIFLIQQKNTTF